MWRMRTEPTGDSMWRGRNMADFAHPAETIMIGDTNDANMYTLAFYYQTADGNDAFRDPPWHQLPVLLRGRACEDHQDGRVFVPG